MFVTYSEMHAMLTPKFHIVQFSFAVFLDFVTKQFYLMSRAFQC